MTCPEPGATELDCEFPFLCGLGKGVIASLVLVVILRCVCSTGAEPAALRVRRGRLNHRGDVGVEGLSVGQASVSDRLVVFPMSPIVSLIKKNLWLAP